MNTQSVIPPWQHGRVLPAFSSWPLPTMTRDSELARRRAENDAKPVDQQVPLAADEMILADWPYYLLSEWQDDRCAICGRRYARWGRLDTDHDHRTGLVRGFLCRPCNTYEGKNPAAGGPWAVYRHRYPAAALDVWIYYEGYAWLPRWWETPALARELTDDPNWALIERAA